MKTGVHYDNRRIKGDEGQGRNQREDTNSLASWNGEICVSEPIGIHELKGYEQT